MKLKTTIALSIFLAISSQAIAADNKRVAQCAVFAMIAKDNAAVQRAFSLADNQRIAMAEANNIIDFIKRSPQGERQTIINSYASACARIGVRVAF